MSFDVLGIIAPHPPIMVPDVGHADSDVTQASAAALHAAADLLASFAPETIVVMSPHTEGFTDAFTVTTDERLRGDLARFGAPRAVHEVPGDPDLARAIVSEASAAGLPTVEHHTISSRASALELDHGVLVPMHFLDPQCRYPLVDMSFTFLGPDAHVSFGRAVRRAAASVGRRVAFVASGDCSHRLKSGAPAGFSPRAQAFDDQLVRLVAAGDFAGIATMDTDLRVEAGECGWRSILVLGGYLEDTVALPRVLAYEGPWGVGYLTAVFAPAAALASLPDSSASTPARGSKSGMKGDVESAPVGLARATVEQYVRHRTTPAPEAFEDPDLPPRAGAFVTLHQDGQLRGCIGTIGPTQPTLAAEIVHNAVQSCSADPRFPPVGEHELDGLNVKVDVLHEPEPVGSFEELDPRVFGVIVTSGYCRGLLLPDLEGVDTAKEQVAIAMRKGSIAPGDPIKLERFKVDRYV